MWRCITMAMNEKYTRTHSYLLEVSSYGSVLQVPGVKQLGAFQAQFFTAPQEDGQVVLQTTQSSRQSKFIILTDETS